MNHFDIHFSFVQFCKTLPVLLKVSASKFFFSSASQILVILYEILPSTSTLHNCLLSPGPELSFG